MTPDTTGYMIAGFTVILVGILIYTLTLFIRMGSIRTKLKKLEELLEYSNDTSERIKPE